MADTVQFGDLSHSAYINNPFGNNTRATPYTLAHRATIRSIQAVLLNNNGTTPSASAAIYSNNAGAPGSLLAKSGATTCTGTGAASTHTFTLQAEVTLDPGTYWLALNNATLMGQIRSRTNGSVNTTAVKSETAPGFASSFGAVGSWLTHFMAIAALGEAVAPPLAVVSVTPDRITVAGGTGTVTVSGGTGTITGVTIDGVAATNVVDNGNETASFTFPAHAVGDFDIGVTRGGETATLTGGVTYYEPEKSEVLGYSSLTDTTASPLRRGAYGTPRGSHAAGAAVIDIQSALTLKIPQEWIGKPLKIKLCSFNKSGLQTQDVALVTAYDFTPTRVDPPAPSAVTLTVSEAAPVVSAGQYRETAVEGAGSVSVADGTVTAPLYAVVEWTMEEPYP